MSRRISVSALGSAPSAFRQFLDLILDIVNRELTKVPHMATTDGDEQTVQFVLKRWQDPESGLDRSWTEEYAVYLSFPDPNNPNKVTVGE